MDALYMDTAIWRQLHVNAASNIEQILQTAPHKTASVRPPVTKTIKIRRTRPAGLCWRSRDELISGVLLWTPSQEREKGGRSAWTYIQQLGADTGCSPEDRPKVMDDREGWRERVRNIRADGVTWWWLLYITNYTIKLSFVYTSSISHNSDEYKSFVCTRFQCQTFPFDPLIGPHQVRSLQIRVDLGAMVMKEYSKFPRAPLTGASLSDYLMTYQDIHWKSLTILQRYNRCILHVQPIGMVKLLDYKIWLIFLKQPVHLKWYIFLNTLNFKIVLYQNHLVINAHWNSAQK